MCKNSHYVFLIDKLGIYSGIIFQVQRAAICEKQKVVEK